MRSRALSAIAAVAALVISLVIAQPAAAAPGTASATTSVDLVSQLVVPKNSSPGKSFTVTATIRSTGIDAADGSSFRIALAPDTTNVTIVSALGQSGAADAIDTTVIPQASPGDRVGPAVTGTLPRMPRGSAIVITVTGTFPGASSARTTLTAIVPPGAVDSDPGTNELSQSTALEGSAEIVMTKTQDKESVALGETRTYTMSFQNNGPSDVIDLSITDYMSFPSGTGRSYSYVLACAAASTAPCPSWITGEVVTGADSYPYPFSKQVSIPADTSLILTAAVTVTANACLPSGRVSMSNTLSRGTAPGIIITGDAYVGVTGTITGPACPETTVEVLKVQDKEAVASGETRTYTVTYRNTGSANIPAMQISDYMSIPSRTGRDYTYSVTCASTPASIPCPSWVTGDAVTGTGSYPYPWAGKSVALPAGKELVLSVPVVVRDAGCFPGGKFSVNNQAARGSADGVALSGATVTNVFGDITGPACAQAAVTVTQSADKDQVALGETRTYTVSYRNDGPADVVGMPVADYMSIPTSPGRKYTYAVTCAEGSACPTWVTGQTMTGSDAYPYPFASKPIDIPVGTTVSLKIAVVVTDVSCVAGGSIPTFSVASRGESDTVAITGGTSVEVPGTITCVDVSTTTAFDDQQPTPRDPLTVSTTVSNSRGTARNIPVKISLPENGFIVLDPSAVSCAPAASPSCPSDLHYDATTHSLQGTIPALSVGQPVTLSLMGFAGIVPPKTKSYVATTTAPADSQGDPSPDSNTTDDSFGFANQQTTVAVTQRIGIPAPEDLTFTGVVECLLQDSMTFSVTVPQGETEGTTSVTDKLWLRDDCTVTMTAPAAPASYTWGPWDPADSQSETMILGPVAQTFARPLAYTPNRIAVPTLAITDPCGLSNASYDVPANDAVHTWTTHSDRSVSLELAFGTAFTDGTNRYTYPVPSDAGSLCPTPPVVSTPTPSQTTTPPVVSTPAPSTSSTPTPSVSHSPEQSPSSTSEPSEGVSPKPSGTPTASPSSTGPAGEHTPPAGTPDTQASSGDGPTNAPEAGLPATGTSVPVGPIVASLMLLLAGAVVLIARRRTQV